jgi:hypothetical protein
MKSLILFAVSPVFLNGAALACSRPKPGAGWGMNALVWDSETIVLARTREAEEGRQSYVDYVMETVEVLKGEYPAEFTLSGDADVNYDNDFNEHSDEVFWQEDVGRAPWPCCLCGPRHTYRVGESYLLFPDAFGAMKSAEIIRSQNDYWYRFVKDKVKSVNTYELRWEKDVPQP